MAITIEQARSLKIGDLFHYCFITKDPWFVMTPWSDEDGFLVGSCYKEGSYGAKFYVENFKKIILPEDAKKKKPKKKIIKNTNPKPSRIMYKLIQPGDTFKSSKIENELNYEVERIDEHFVYFVDGMITIHDSWWDSIAEEKWTINGENIYEWIDKKLKEQPKLIVLTKRPFLI